MFCSARARSAAVWCRACGQPSARRALTIRIIGPTHQHVQGVCGWSQGIATITIAGVGLSLASPCPVAAEEVDAVVRDSHSGVIMTERTGIIAKGDATGDTHCTPFGFASWSDSERPTVLLLVRHGERFDYVDPAWVQRNRQAEPWNPPLSAAGGRQADALSLAVNTWCRKLGMKLGAVYSSPLRRTTQTAEPTAARFGLEVEAVPCLMEWLATEFYTAWACQDSTGHWGSGKTEILEQFVGIVHQPAADLIGMKDGPRNHFFMPESQETMTERVSSGIEKLAADHAGQLVLVVGHGGPTAFSAARLSETPSAEIPMAGYTGIYVLIRRPLQSKWTVLACNDISHLSGL